MRELAGAWRDGELETLTEKLLADFAGFPGLYDSLVVDRNRRWIAPLEQYLRERRRYLVVVGALHLVGPDNVVTLLEQRGYTRSLGCGNSGWRRSQTSTISKSSLPDPQSGQRHESGMSAHFVPGGIPSSGRPTASS